MMRVQRKLISQVRIRWANASSAMAEYLSMGLVTFVRNLSVLPEHVPLEQEK